jgi:nucleotide-binding universal stress UspA family protein
MSFGIKKIGLAVAFSPTAKALLAEASRLATLFQGELILMHVGLRDDVSEKQLESLIQATPTPLNHKIVWKSGDPAREILAICREEKIDLLVAGALKKENLLQNYMGTVARKIMRKANCSILMIQNPSAQPSPIQNVVVDAEESQHTELALQAACEISLLEKAHWLHVVRELKLLGLTLSVNEQCNEEEYSETKQSMVREEIEQVEKKLARIPHQGLKVNIKMLSGKSGFELARFAERKKAELLVVSAPAERLSLLDRLFPHDLEYIFANLPCNLLVVKSRKA